MSELLSSVIDINILNEMDLSERSKKMFLNSVEKYDDYIKKRKYEDSYELDTYVKKRNCNIKKDKENFEDEEYEFKFDNSKKNEDEEYDSKSDKLNEDEEYEFKFDKENEDEKEKK